jgi:hypothetical protein
MAFEKKLETELLSSFHYLASLVKQINSKEIWTDSFINNANVMIDRHHLLAGYSLSYMSIIRGAVVYAPLTGLINTANNVNI